MNTNEPEVNPTDVEDDTEHTVPSDLLTKQPKKAWSLEDWVNGAKGGDFRVRSTLTGYKAIR